MESSEPKTGQPSIKSRYQDGSDGNRRLIAALCEQHVVEHDETIAKNLASQGSLVEFDSGATLVEQGAADTDVYFLLDGQVDIFVNRRLVAQRHAGESIGEMVITDTTARRSASVIANGYVLAFKVTEPTFSALAGAYPKLWKPIAKVTAQRLRERTKFHRPPNAIPRLFVGSSVEGLPLANELAVGFKHDKIDVRIWSLPGLFSPGGVSIDVLMKEVDAADFAVFLFGPDDKIVSREGAHNAPRDNVVFELGLFMGRLDRDRALVIKEHSSDVKIPTDLLGITPLTYVRKENVDSASMMASVCVELRKTIVRQGVR